MVAVNTVDKAGKPINSQNLIGRDFSQTNWFKTVMSGQIKAGQAFVEDPKFDEDVKKLYPDSNGYAMNFSSPVYDSAGNIIGAWTNRMDVDNINQIILDNLKVEKDKGLNSAKVHVLNEGNITIYDEKNENMDKNGLESLPPEVKTLVKAKKDGFIIENEKIYGTIRSKGFSTYPARNWAILFYDDAMKGLNTLKYANFGIFAVALLIAVGLTMFATKSIVAPIEGLIAVAGQISRGDLAAKLPETLLKSDQRLADAFSNMIGNLKSLVTEVQEAANHVASASAELSENAGQTTRATQQISSAIEDLTRGNTDQVCSVDQSVEQVEELAKSIEAIAAGAAEQVAGLEKTSGFIEEMARGIDEVSTNAEKIAYSANQSAEAAGKIQDLGQQSQQIGEIVQVIDDIAEQTNLLALNAAIEAARAGEHGKGFAVVADEVRKLAERSSKATKEIADLINIIQAGTNNAVNAMDRGTKEVEEGVILAEKAGAALKQILQNIQETKDQVTTITALTGQVAEKSDLTVQVANDMGNITNKNIVATEEMSAGSRKVSKAIVTISNVTQQNAAAAEEVSASTEQMNATVEQIAASAQQLSEMARNLKSEVTKFKV